MALAATVKGPSNARSLSAEAWTVTNEHGNITLPGKFPSHVHLDLYAAHVISKLIPYSLDGAAFPLLTSSKMTRKPSAPIFRTDLL